MTDPTVPVTQADIGWAESAAQHLCHPADRDAAVRLLADAFARHRIAARREGMEEAARIADELGGDRIERNGDGSLRSYDMDNKHGRSDAMLNGMRVRAQTIATAIRTAIEQGAPATR